VIIITIPIAIVSQIHQILINFKPIESKFQLIEFKDIKDIWIALRLIIGKMFRHSSSRIEIDIVKK